MKPGSGKAPDVPDPATTPVSIGIVIANYNTPGETASCVSALLDGGSDGVRLEILVIDNSDREPGFESTTARVIRPDGNIGLGGAWALGYRALKGLGVDYCLFLNSDALVAPTFFPEMLRGIREYGSEAVLGPRILHRDDPDAIWSRGGSIKVHRITADHYGGGMSARATPARDFETGHLSGCCILVPMPLLDRIHGPDPRYFFHGEEMDLNHRLREAGGRLMLLDSAEVFHGVSRSHERLSPRILYYAYRAKVLFARKVLGKPAFLVWFAFGLLYSNTVGPVKFYLWSRGRMTFRELRELRRALHRAFLDGWSNDTIRGADFDRVRTRPRGKPE